ncbi:hypothetical protein BV25DRAFT_1840014 [Artomyces pyxidatus]|uniref:Uncharacterized protein n=1 Tax=Artomyces pyxidatus TaxID=48021 RepID=A0ACB8STW2_9AGAM|nr:hypothetical protein BV25DRAFT_1840014 [Artomyces pyxidatus]
MKSSLWTTPLARLPARMLIVAFALSVGVNIVALFIQIGISFPPVKSYTHLPHDHPRELPLGRLSTVNMDFHDDVEHYSLNGTQSMGWDSMFPQGNAVIYLGEASGPYQVSMWQQLQCLNHLRNIIAYGDDGSERTEHCFHYLRKALLCAADTTLEEVGTGTVLEGERETGTGEQATHTCKDWTQVYGWQTKQYMKWTAEMQQGVKQASPGQNY